VLSVEVSVEIVATRGESHEESQLPSQYKYWLEEQLFANILFAKKQSVGSGPLQFSQFEEQGKHW